MKIKNTSIYPKFVCGTRLEPGQAKEITGLEAAPSSTYLEVVEKSGQGDSDQNTKNEKSEEQNEERGE